MHAHVHVYKILTCSQIHANVQVLHTYLMLCFAIYAYYISFTFTGA